MELVAKKIAVGSGAQQGADTGTSAGNTNGGRGLGERSSTNATITDNDDAPLNKATW